MKAHQIVVVIRDVRVNQGIVIHFVTLAHTLNFRMNEYFFYSLYFTNSLDAGRGPSIQDALVQYGLTCTSVVKLK